MEIKFTDREIKQIQEIKSKFAQKDEIYFERGDNDYGRLQGTLGKLAQGKYIEELHFSGWPYFDKLGRLDFIEDEIKDQEKMDKKLSRREWRIAITSAVIGGIAGAGSSYLVSFLAK